MIRNTNANVTVPAATRIEYTYAPPTISSYNWYCINVNPATANVFIRSHTLGGTAQIQNDVNSATTSTHVVTWIGVHK